MPTGDYHEEVPNRGDALEEHSFDGLAKGMAKGAISRGSVLKLASATLLGSALGVFSLSENAQARRRRKCINQRFIDPRCNTSGCSAGCTGSNCSCVRTSENNFLCVEQFCPTFPQSCTTSLQCPGTQVCMVNNCCSGSGNVCVTLCGSTTPFASSASGESSANGWSTS